MSPGRRSWRGFGGTAARHPPRRSCFGRELGGAGGPAGRGGVPGPGRSARLQRRPGAPPGPGGRLAAAAPGRVPRRGHRLTDEARVRAAWLWAADPDAAGPRAAGPKVAVTGPAAAHWHGMLARGPAVVDVTVPRGTKPRAQPGLRVHRRDLSAADVVTVRGLAVAGRGLATLETAIALPDGAAFLDRALQR